MKECRHSGNPVFAIFSHKQHNERSLTNHFATMKSGLLRSTLCLVSLMCLLCLVMLNSGTAYAASPEWESPPVSHKDVQPYFEASKLHTMVLPPAPEPGSALDIDDVAAVLLRQRVDTTRRQQAELDAKLLYERFADIFGRPISRASLPALIELLNRTEKQVSGPAFAAKELYRRLRPYQRLTLTEVCGSSNMSKPDLDATKRTSYPSGHSAYGWTAALVLARVAPAKAHDLLQRAREYADSRVICGMHFPSDVEAGRQLATAVVAQLDTLPAFQRDLERARAELLKAPR